MILDPDARPPVEIYLNIKIHNPESTILYVYVKLGRMKFELLFADYDFKFHEGPSPNKCNCSSEPVLVEQTSTLTLTWTSVSVSQPAPADVETATFLVSKKCSFSTVAL